MFLTSVPFHKIFHNEHC